MKKLIVLSNIFLTATIFTACVPMEIGFEEDSIFHSDQPTILFADDKKKSS